MYTKEQLRRLLIPLMFEQVLNALMGSVDTIMVTNIGSAPFPPFPLSIH